ncbi:MAG: leucyl/phenylalanyl-tRNA--protein transferase [Verrucomicrobia bacterium]|nr:leucyl/phenylalanyl-tRNA--protein transferase [Verrucomicrobiota bacterium]
MSSSLISSRILGTELRFPDPRHALRGDYEGLVAIGGDLSLPRLELAYRSGLFPWSINPITWWSPDPRAVFDLDAFHIGRTLRKTLKRQRFEVTRDTAFEAVMRGCAEPVAGREETWVSDDFIEAYCALHRAGHAHSVECWAEGKLAGGIYGVQIGGFFAGESMFHRADDASKVAFCHLMEHLRDRGFALFDTQVINPTTRQLGAYNIPRDTYLRRLELALAKPCEF